MAEPSSREVVDRMIRATEEKDIDAQLELMADDYVDEMPQSGERTSKANWRATFENYPGGVGTTDKGGRVVGAEDRWVMTPTFNVLRIEGSGNVFTYVCTVTYSDGSVWQMITIAEIRDGKLAKTTSWYAAPFEAPEWRAPFVERFTPLG
jgi:hypothetical protein